MLNEISCVLKYPLFHNKNKQIKNTVKNNCIMIITRFIEKILPGASYPQKSKVPEGEQPLRETV